MDSAILDATDRCIRYRIPFIAYALPGADEVTFLANPSGCDMPDDSCVAISFFGTDATTVDIRPELTAEEVLQYDCAKLPLPAIYPHERSTTRQEHSDAVNRIAGRLRHDGGKTVLSRAITGQRQSDDWRNVIDNLFSNSPFAFRFAYYTSETGCWFGASPELLGATDADNEFTTMALAGTRTHGEPWDAKNREEHQMVVDYITGTLAESGLMPVTGPEETVKCGPVEHLRHIISARINNPRGISFTDIIRRLSPTPALAGYPLGNAMADIAQNETHPRFCYGGYIAIRLADGTRQAYVNLRSCHFHERNYCIYAGGGITAQSNPDTEWEETEAKASAILKFFI